MLAIVAVGIAAVIDIRQRTEAEASLRTEIDTLLVEALGGGTTAFTRNRNAFSLSVRNLTDLERRAFEVGDSFFNQSWVTAPASTDARDGLGLLSMPNLARRAILWTGAPNRPRTMMTLSASCSSGLACPAWT